MFVDFREGPPPEPWRPARPEPRLSARGRTVMTWIIGFNVAMLFLGPLAGVTVFEGVAALWR